MDIPISTVGVQRRIQMSLLKRLIQSWGIHSISYAYRPASDYVAAEQAKHVIVGRHAGQDGTRILIGVR